MRDFIQHYSVLTIDSVKTDGVSIPVKITIQGDLNHSFLIKPGIPLSPEQSAQAATCGAFAHLLQDAMPLDHLCQNVIPEMVTATHHQILIPTNHCDSPAAELLIREAWNIRQTTIMPEDLNVDGASQGRSVLEQLKNLVASSTNPDQMLNHEVSARYVENDEFLEIRTKGPLYCGTCSFKLGNPALPIGIDMFVNETFPYGMYTNTVPSPAMNKFLELIHESEVFVEFYPDHPLTHAVQRAFPTPSQE